MSNRGIIPKIFHKAEGGLLGECIMCNQNLLAPPQDYLLEKAFRIYPEYKKTEVIFEYAMCLTCAHAMHNELSEESRQRIEAYFAERLQLSSRDELLKPKRASFKNWVGNCLVKGTSLKQSNEYVLYGHAHGRQLVYDFFLTHFQVRQWKKSANSFQKKPARYWMILLASIFRDLRRLPRY
jgi:hypothetical protein